MEKRKVSNGELTLYTSIKQLPIIRYNQLNGFVAQQLGIGDDMSAFNAHLSKMDGFMASNDINNARLERANLHYNIFMLLENIDISSRAFLCFVSAINDQPVGDLDNDAECSDALKLLYATGITYGDAEDIFEEIKKKLIKS